MMYRGRDFSADINAWVLCRTKDCSKDRSFGESDAGVDIFHVANALNVPPAVQQGLCARGTG